MVRMSKLIGSVLAATLLAGCVTAPDIAPGRPGARDPAPPPPAAASRMRGVYSYQADAGLFAECGTGRRVPVAQEGDNAALEAAYTQVRPEPGAAMLAIVDARLEPRSPPDGRPPRPALVVERFVEVQPGRGCDGVIADAPLEYTSWKLVRLGRSPVDPAAAPQEPHLILQPGRQALAGSGGCNRLVGRYAVDGEHLTLGPLAGTRMACPRGMALEQGFLDALSKVDRWRVAGERLELFDAAGASLALFEARPR